MHERANACVHVSICVSVSVSLRMTVGILITVLFYLIDRVRHSSVLLTSIMRDARFKLQFYLSFFFLVISHLFR